MKTLTRALGLTVASGALIACSAQYFSSSNDPTQTGAQTATYGVLGVGAPAPKPKGRKIKPFFRMETIEPHLEDMDAMALAMPDETLPADGAPTKVRFNVKGSEKWSVSSGSFLTGGHLEFEDKGRKLKFKGDVDDDGLYLADELIYAHLEGTLKEKKKKDKDDDKGYPDVPAEAYRFSLDVYELSPVDLGYDFCVTLASDPNTPIYAYRGSADKGSLKITLR